MNAHRDGFTLVELIITLVIMVALMSLGVAGISTLQAQGRDKEREQDIATVANALEVYYNSGSTLVAGATKGTYPNGDNFTTIINSGSLGDILPGVSTQSLSPPNKTTADFIIASSKTDAEIQSALDAYQYVYIPYADASSTSAAQSTPAVRFVMKYKKESDGTIITTESKHQ